MIGILKIRNINKVLSTMLGVRYREYFDYAVLGAKEKISEFYVVDLKKLNLHPTQSDTLRLMNGEDWKTILPTYGHYMCEQPTTHIEMLKLMTPVTDGYIPIMVVAPEEEEINLHYLVADLFKSMYDISYIELETVQDLDTLISYFRANNDCMPYNEDKYNMVLNHISPYFSDSNIIEHLNSLSVADLQQCLTEMGVDMISFTGLSKDELIDLIITKRKELKR